jgi:DNA primase small subunit
VAIKTLDFLIRQFVTYYKEHGDQILPPTRFHQREFAFFWFSKHGTLRHIGFVDVKELIKFTENEGPAHVFYSAASYDIPDAPQMPLKGWQGADLIFDIDADHLDVLCHQRHDWWSCTECNYKEKGLKPEACPKCNSHKLSEFRWMCEECLNAAKGEAIKIIENFLIPDFGITKKEIAIVFSGHRGYHIHCFSDMVRELGSTERREIVDYIQGTGLDLEMHGFRKDAHRNIRGPDSQMPGWESKLAQELLRLFQSPDEIQHIPRLTTSQKQILHSHANTIVDAMNRTPARYITPKGVGLAAWRSISKYVITKLRAQIDEPVTTDIHRLIRLPGSLHGKTGFLVKRLETANLDKFDPFRDAQVFQGTTKVIVHEVPAFRIGDVEYPAMNEITKELPLSVAVFLMCKGAADLTA